MMAPVIEHSPRFLSDEGIRSMAVFLKALPPVSGSPVKKQKMNNTAIMLEGGNADRTN